MYNEYIIKNDGENMKRKKIEKNTKLVLKSKSGEEFTYVVENMISDFGMSCICYKAYRINKNGTGGKEVLLKQFNPIGDQKREDFEKSVEIIQKLLSSKATKKYVCADNEIEVLYDEETIYCENQYYKSFVSWKELANQKVNIYELLQTAISVIHFLRELHGLGLAYIDLKPEDILIPLDEMGTVLFTQPMFFDFNSCLESNRAYDANVLRNYTTERYRADIFSDYTLNEIEINVALENEMFANVLESLVERKYQTVSESVKARLVKLFEELRKSINSKWSEEQIEVELISIQEQILDEEHIGDDKHLKGRIKKYNIIRIVFLIITIMGHVNITFRLVDLCLKVDKTISHEWLRKEMFSIFLLTVILIIVKLLYWWLAERIANYYVSLKSYQERTNRYEYHIFRRGFRVNTTFQDDHESNEKRQRRRLVLWFTLFVALVSSILISVIWRSFAVFLELGFISLLVFLYADFLPSQKEYYDLYLKSNGNPNWNAKVLFYQDEYNETGFELEHEFYKYRNLFELKRVILNEYFDASKLASINWHEKMKCLFDYNYRYDMLKKQKVRQLDLGYGVLHMRHVYKMCFDRIRNRQLIVMISSVVLMLAILGLDFSQYIEGVKVYFGFEQEMYLGITLLLNLFFLVISIYQILCVLPEEMLVSSLAYKSRYMLDESLSEQIVIDIAAGIIKKKDLARGLWQCWGYINTTTNYRIRRALAMEFTYERPLLHHTVITNRSRLAFTVWFLFGILFAFLVLQLQIYFLTPVLLFITAIVHYLLRKYLLPVLGKKKLIREIEKLNKYSGN